MQKLGGGGGETLANLWEASLSLKRKRLSSAHEIGSSDGRAAWFRRGSTFVSLRGSWYKFLTDWYPRRIKFIEDSLSLSLFSWTSTKEILWEEIASRFFSLLLSSPQRERKKKRRGGRKVRTKEMLVIPRLSDELRDASRFVAASHSRNFDHLNADQPVHLCLHSHNSSPVMESTNISIHSQRGEAHEGFTKLTLGKREKRRRHPYAPTRKKTELCDPACNSVSFDYLWLFSVSLSSLSPSLPLFSTVKSKEGGNTNNYTSSSIYLQPLRLNNNSLRDSGIVLNLNYTFVIPNKNLDSGFRKR